jgi:hypothetical protein
MAIPIRRHNKKGQEMRLTDYPWFIAESIAILRTVFDAFCHWMCDKRLGGYARLQDSETRDDDPIEAAPVFEKEAEPQNHWEAIYYIVKCGNLLGYKA